MIPEINIHEATNLSDYQQCLALIEKHIVALNVPGSEKYLSNTVSNLRETYSCRGAHILLSEDCAGMIALHPLTSAEAQLGFFYVRPERRKTSATEPRFYC